MKQLVKFLAAECLRISLEFNISAWAWVLYVGNHSRPTPLTIISFLLLLLFRLVGWAAELGPVSYPDFLSFFPYGVFSTGFFWSPTNHDVLLVVAQHFIFFSLAVIGGI